MHSHAYNSRPDATFDSMKAREPQDPPNSSLESYWPSAPQAGTAGGGLPWRHACAFLAFLVLVLAGLALLMRYLGSAH